MQEKEKSTTEYYFVVLLFYPDVQIGSRLSGRLAFPNEKLIFQTGTAVVECADRSIFTFSDDVTLSRAEGPFAGTTSGQEIPFLTFISVWHNAYAPIITEVQFISHFLTVK